MKALKSLWLHTVALIAGFLWTLVNYLDKKGK